MTVSAVAAVEPDHAVVSIIGVNFEKLFSVERISIPVNHEQKLMPAYEHGPKFSPLTRDLSLCKGAFRLHGNNICESPSNRL